MKILKYLLLTLPLSAPALAGQEDTELANVGDSTANRLKYSYSNQEFENSEGEKSSEHWVNVKSGHLTAGIRSDLDAMSVRFNGNFGQLLGLENTDAGKNFLNRVQVEAANSSPGTSYALLGVEANLVSPVNLFLATIHNPGGVQRFMGGPIFYYGDNTTMIFYYPKSEPDSLVDHSLLIRNRFRNLLPHMWMDLDFSHKETTDESFSPYGYGVTLGVWKVWTRVKVTPYWEGLARLQRNYELGFEANF